MRDSKIRYQVALFGAGSTLSKVLRSTLRARLADLGVESDAVTFLSGAAVRRRDKRLPLVAVYFGVSNPKPSNIELLNEILVDSPVILPVVDNLEDASKRLPESIQMLNAIQLTESDPALERVASFLLQQFRLLRKDRRVFISYRRNEAAATAAQIYDALDSCGFDVFLDTRSVPAGEDFQDVLWHRMADSDVVVLLDTPGFSESRWTVAELARANATNIQILQLLWPGVEAGARSALSHLRILKQSSFVRSNPTRRGVLKAAVLKNICVEVESLRARAIAARHRFLVDSLCDLARLKGLEASVYPDRSILVQGSYESIVVVPVVGVPTSVHLEDEFSAVGRAEKGCGVYVLYDERGLLRRFRSHLGWLNDALPVRSVGVFEVTRLLDKVAS